MIAWLSNNSQKKKFSIPHPRHGRVWGLALQSLGRILSYLTCMLPYHIVRKHIFNQINPHGKNSGDDGGQIEKQLCIIPMEKLILAVPL